jgi:PAS domain S-box-containing protein
MSQNLSRNESLPEDLIEDLQALTPAQLQAAKTFLKDLRRRSLPGLPASTGKFAANSRALQPPDVFLSLYADTLCIEECDQASADLLGVSPVGQLFLELVDSEYRDSALHAFEVVRAHKETKNVRLRLLRPQGKAVPVNMTARWVDSYGGKPDLIDIVCRDISYLKRIGNIEIFSEMLSIGIFLVDERGDIAFANTSAEKIFGYEQSELEHQPLASLFPNESINALADERLNLLDYHHLQIERARELRGLSKQGHEVALKISWSFIRLEGNRFAVASITDLTASKSIEGVLRKHEEQKELIFSKGLLGDFVWNVERDDLKAHPRLFKLYGAAPITGPVAGDWFRSRQHPEDREPTKVELERQLAAGSDLAVEFRVNGDDGVTRWVECRGIAIRDEHGVPIEVRGLNIDITERKLAEIERRESEARALRAEALLRTALEYSNTVVWRWHIDEGKLEWWGGVKQLYGVDASALSSLAGFRQLVLPSDLLGVQETIAKNLDSGNEIFHEFRIARPDGEIRWITSRAGMLRDSSGKVYAMAGVNFDVTNRKVAEEELKQNERDFRELANVLPQIVFRANAAGEIDYRNKRYFEVSGFSDEEEAKLRWAEVLHPEDRDRLLQVWRDSISSGHPYQDEFRLFDSRHKQYRWFLSRAVPVRDASGTVLRWIGATTDIHDQKTAEERLDREVQSRTSDLRQREEQLKKSLLEKDALLREIHHRVKNNLQIVSSLLSMQAENEGIGAAVAPLRDSERRISSMAMIHEQLYGTEDLQTIEFAEHAQRLSESLFASMAGSALVTCRLDLEPVNLTINQAIPCALILNELLTNALKYAYPHEQGGEITVRLAIADGMVTLTVSDNGVGLPSNVDPFLPKTLGLEIVQVLVSQLDGELTVVGSPGATFSAKFRPQGGPAELDRVQSRSTLLNHS